jgi:hypothetical protein
MKITGGGGGGSSSSYISALRSSFDLRFLIT